MEGTDSTEISRIRKQQFDSGHPSLSGSGSYPFPLSISRKAACNQDMDSIIGFQLPPSIIFYYLTEGDLLLGFPHGSLVPFIFNECRRAGPNESARSYRKFNQTASIIPNPMLPFSPSPAR